MGRVAVLTRPLIPVRSTHPGTQFGAFLVLQQANIIRDRLPVADEQMQNQQNQFEPLASTSVSVGTPLPAQHRPTPSTGSWPHVTNHRMPEHRTLFHDHPRPRSSNLGSPSSYDVALRDRMNQHQNYSHPRARPDVQNELINGGPATYGSPPIFDPNEPDPEHSRPFAWECWALRLLLQDMHGYNESDLQAYLRAEYSEALRRKDARTAYMRQQHGRGY
jgi:hypothetical protein